MKFKRIYLLYSNLHEKNKYVLKRGTTWNDLKQPKTNYNEQKTTWNDLQWSTTSKKQPETTYNEQEIT